MRANKQIHKEVEYMLYSSAALEIEISGRGVKFLGSQFVSSLYSSQARSKLAAAIKRFRKLYLTLLREAKPKHDNGGNHPSRMFKDFLNCIGLELMAEGGQGWDAPKQVTISYRDERWALEKVEESVEWHLRPFRNIRGLDAATVIHRSLLQKRLSPVERRYKEFTFIKLGLDEERRRHDTSVRRQQEEKPIQDRINKVMGELASDIRGNSPLRERHPLFFAFASLNEWIQSMERGWYFNNERIHAVLVEAWKAHDEGRIDDFHLVLKTLRGYHEDIARNEIQRCNEEIQRLRVWSQASQLTTVKGHLDDARDDWDYLREASKVD